MTHLFTISLFAILCCMPAEAQDAAVNRRKVIGIILSESKNRVNADKHNNVYTLAPAAQNTSLGFRQVSAIPRYCLPKGAIVCRLEEYVQLHSPFKLNIGVGGE